MAELTNAQKGWLGVSGEWWNGGHQVTPDEAIANLKKAFDVNGPAAQNQSNYEYMNRLLKLQNPDRSDEDIFKESGHSTNIYQGAEKLFGPPTQVKALTQLPITPPQSIPPVPPGSPPNPPMDPKQKESQYEAPDEVKGFESLQSQQEQYKRQTQNSAAMQSLRSFQTPQMSQDRGRLY